LSGIFGFEVPQNLLVPLNRWLKRALDIAGALIMGALALPLIAASVWIKLFSRGPAIYQQEREVEGAGSLWIPKLRTMYLDAKALLIRMLPASPQARAEWSRHFKFEEGSPLSPRRRPHPTTEQPR
jgi:UDP-galactose-lipid carrier transferase